MTVSIDRVHRSENNFDFLRFVAALLVVFFHSYWLSGDQVDPLSLYTITITFGSLGVAIFFCISGYLITKSWVRTPSGIVFFKSRLLRIWPGLAIAILASVFIIGPLVTTQPLRDYIYRPATWDYLQSLTIFNIRFVLPGVFADNPFPGSVNGSLWTLPIEFKMYIIIFVIGLIGVLSRKWLVLAANAILIFLFSYLSLFESGFRDTVMVTNLSLGIYFMMGTAFYLYRDRVKYDLRIVAVSLAALVLTVHTKYFEILFFVVLPYLTFYVAFLPWKRLNNFGKYGDPSYGMYIYAFPIQQVIAKYCRGIQKFELFFTTLAILIPISYLSWHLVEAQALKLKGVRLFPGSQKSAATYARNLYESLFNMVLVVTVLYILFTY